MGERFGFRCDACAYEVTVPGGPDLGMGVATQTVACAKCKSLFDVVTSENPGRVDAPSVPLRCPRRRAHRVTAWNGGDPCPRCHGAMRPTDVLELWD